MKHDRGDRNKENPGATIDHTQLSFFKQNLKSELLVTSEVTDFSSKALWPSFMYTVLFQFYVTVARILFRFGGGGRAEEKHFTSDRLSRMERKLYSWYLPVFLFLNKLV